MKKVTLTTNIILVFVIVLLPMTVFSQNWRKTYDSTTFIQSIIPLNDDGFLAIGHNQANRIRPIDSIYLLRIDKNGNLIKAKRWLINQLPLVQQVTDSSFLFVLSPQQDGQPSTIVKFSYNLDSIWSKKIFQREREVLRANRFNKLSDGSLGLATSPNKDTAYFFKINANGDIINTIKVSTFFGPRGDIGFVDFIEEANKNLIIISYGYEGRAAKCLLKFDSIGTFLGLIEINDNPSRIYQTQDGNFLLLWGELIRKISNNGTLIWERRYTSSLSFWLGALPLNDNSFALIRSSESIDSIYKFRVLKLNSNNTVDTLCSIPAQMGHLYDQIWNFFINKNQKIIFSGFRYDENSRKYHGLVVKENLELNCSPSSIFDNIKNTTLVYPNPLVNDAIITVNSKELFGRQCSFSLFDVWGRLVKADKFIGEKYHFYRQNLVNGLYIFQIKDGTQIIGSGKLFLN